MLSITYNYNIRSSEDNQRHFVNVVRCVDLVPYDQGFYTVILFDNTEDKLAVKAVALADFESEHPGLE